MFKALLYTISTLLFIITLPVSATDISINSVSIPFGEPIVVDILISPTEKVSGYQFDLQYNKSIFDPVITEGDIFTKEGYSAYYHNGSPSVIGRDNILSVILGPYYITTPGIASTVSLNPDYSKITIGQELYINLTEVLIASDIASPVPYTIHNSRVVIVPNFDLNQDGQVNVLDLIAVIHHIKEPISLLNQKYDLNQDKQINILDLLQIISHMG